MMVSGRLGGLHFGGSGRLNGMMWDSDTVRLCLFVVVDMFCLREESVVQVKSSFSMRFKLLLVNSLIEVLRLLSS